MGAKFQDFDLVTEPEIEVAPITPEQWDRILQMSQDAVANITQEERL